MRAFAPRSTVHSPGYDTFLVGDADTTDDYSEYGMPPADKVIAHTNMYWSLQSAPGRSAGVVETADVDFEVREPRPRREEGGALRVRTIPGGEAAMSNDEWVARDAAVVWHGFTQMDGYADNSPIVVDRTEGRYVIDADGNRYLDAISSLWVTTLGHHVPELDDAIVSQLQRGAHTTMLGNGNTVVVELSEALARSCRSTTRTSSTRPTARARSSRR